jgi:hypothetical protein
MQKILALSATHRVADDEIGERLYEGNSSKETGRKIREKKVRPSGLKQVYFHPCKLDSAPSCDQLIATTLGRTFLPLNLAY